MVGTGAAAGSGIDAFFLLLPALLCVMKEPPSIKAEPIACSTVNFSCSVATAKIIANGTCSWTTGAVRFTSVDAPFQARENVGVVVARGRMLSSVRPLMRQGDSRRPVWEFADRVQITHSVLEAQWKPLVVPAPSRRRLRHTLLPLALTSSRSWSAYAAAVGVL